MNRAVHRGRCFPWHQAWYEHYHLQGCLWSVVVRPPDRPADGPWQGYMGHLGPLTPARGDEVDHAVSFWMEAEW